MVSKTIGWNLFFKPKKNWGNSRTFLISSVNSTYLAEYSIKYIFIKFHQNFATKKWNIYVMEHFNLCPKKKNCFKWTSIVCHHFQVKLIPFPKAWVPIKWLLIILKWLVYSITCAHLLRGFSKFILFFNGENFYLAHHKKEKKPKFE
jgi:hypothetical protein